MKHSYKIKYENLLLRQIEQSDLDSLRKWRNDKKYTRFLRPIGEITPEMQTKWYEGYLNNKNELGMAIVECHHIRSVIGSIFLYDFNGKQAEFGKFLIGDERAHGQGYGKTSLVMLLKLGFETLGLRRIVAEVHKDNISAYKIYKHVGCRVIGEQPSCVGGTEFLLEIDRATLINLNPIYQEIVVDGVH